MTKHKASLSRIKLLALITFTGISSIAATPVIDLKSAPHKPRNHSEPTGSSRKKPSPDELDEYELYDQTQQEGQQQQEDTEIHESEIEDQSLENEEVPDGLADYDLESDPFLLELLEEAISETGNEDFADNDEIWEYVFTDKDEEDEFSGEFWKEVFADKGEEDEFSDEIWEKAFSDENELSDEFWEKVFTDKGEEEEFSGEIWEKAFAGDDEEESSDDEIVLNDEEEDSENEITVWVRSESLNKKLLPLNEAIYRRIRDNAIWTRNDAAEASEPQAPTAKVVMGSLAKKSQPSSRKPTGMKITKTKQTIESAEGSVASTEAKVKMQDIIEFGIASDDLETDPDIPFAAKDLKPDSRKNIFLAWKSTSRPEHSFYALDDGVDPFDEEAQSVNEAVFSYQHSQASENLVAEADAAPSSMNEQPQSSSQKTQPTESAAEWQAPAKETQPTESAAEWQAPAKKTQPTENAAEWQAPAKETQPTESAAEWQAPAKKTQPTENAAEWQAPAKKTQPVEKGAKAKTPAPEKIEKETTGYLVKFNNAKMSEYLGFISKISGKNFIFDPADLDFRVTIVSNEPTSLENVMSALLQELRFRGLDMVEVGNNIIIHKNAKINSPAHVIKENGEIPKNLEIVTRVYRLLNTDPSTMAAIIRPMLSASAVIESITSSGHLIVTGIKSNINRITELIESIDSPEAGLEIGQYQAQHLPVSQAISIAKEMLAPLARDKTLVMVPLSNKNLVYIVTTPNLLVEALKIFQQIDQGYDLPRTQFDIDQQGRPIINPNDLEARARALQEQPFGSVEATKFYVHKLQYRKGGQIQQALQAIAQSLEDIQVQIENYDFIATINSVQWIESTNSLVFTGTPATLEKVQQLIDELDTALPQVLIEILVIEATVDDSLTFGVDWGTRFGEPTSAGAQAFLQENSPLNAALDSGVPGVNLDPSGLAREAGFNLGVIGRTISRGGCDFNTMGALVRALHTDRRIDVLLNPKIVVEDNAVAEFFVGINTPFQTQSIANDLGTVITGNFEFRDVGSTIKITPIIGNNGIVTLEIEQEISSAAANNVIGGGTTQNVGTGQINPTTGTATTSGGGVQNSISSTAATTNIGPTTRKSTTKTRVHMPDGYFIILSGQIRDEKEEINTQVPCLGGIPWLGGLFRSKQNNIIKNNLMIFIRPQIIDVEKINPITKRQQDIWIERKRNHKRWEYEVDEALQYFNVRDPYCGFEERPLRE